MGAGQGEEGALIEICIVLGTHVVTWSIKDQYLKDTRNYAEWAEKLDILTQGHPMITLSSKNKGDEANFIGINLFHFTYIQSDLNYGKALNFRDEELTYRHKTSPV